MRQLDTYPIEDFLDKARVAKKINQKTSILISYLIGYLIINIIFNLYQLYKNGKIKI